jgi:hypothetical protein
MVLSIMMMIDDATWKYKQKQKTKTKTKKQKSKRKHRSIHFNHTSTHPSEELIGQLTD